MVRKYRRSVLNVSYTPKRDDEGPRHFRMGVSPPFGDEIECCFIVEDTPWWKIKMFIEDDKLSI